MLIDVPTKGAVEMIIRKTVNKIMGDSLDDMAIRLLNLEKAVKTLDESITVLIKKDYKRVKPISEVMIRRSKEKEDGK